MTSERRARMCGVALMMSVLAAMSGQGGAEGAVNAWSTNGPYNGAVAVDVAGVAVGPDGTVYATGPVLVGGLYKSTDHAATWSAPVPVYGHIPAVDPSNPNIVYLGGGAPNGVPNPPFLDRLNKSLDGGVTWTRVELGLSMRPMNALAIDPSHPATLYAGFGNQWVFSSSLDFPRLLKSIDGGTTWTNLSGIPADNYGIYDLAIDPRNPETLYAADVGEGPYKSTDGGATWAYLTYADEHLSANSVAVDSQTSTLYVGTGGGVFKSTGGSLPLIPTGPDRRGVACLAIDPVNPNILYSCGFEGPLVGYPRSVFTSADGGATWSVLNDGLGVSGDGLGSRYSINDLAIDPSDHTVIYAATNAGVFVMQRPALNGAPVANAGTHLTAECASPAGTEVMLDGGASSDPEGSALTYVWTGAFGRVEGPRPTVKLPLGVSTITLVVNDGDLDSVPDLMTVDVRDTLAPTVEVTAAPALLWPPNGRLVEVMAHVTAIDRCDPSPAIVLLDATSSEPADARRPAPSIVGADLGTDDRSMSLRAEGSSSGRTYTITYSASDASGNAATASGAVQVAHEARR